MRIYLMHIMQNVKSWSFLLYIWSKFAKKGCHFQPWTLCTCMPNDCCQLQPCEGDLLASWSEFLFNIYPINQWSEQQKPLFALLFHPIYRLFPKTCESEASTTHASDQNQDPLPLLPDRISIIYIYIVHVYLSPHRYIYIFIVIYLSSLILAEK